jgi:hypothetical protein
MCLCVCMCVTFQIRAGIKLRIMFWGSQKLYIAVPLFKIKDIIAIVSVVCCPLVAEIRYIMFSNGKNSNYETVGYVIMYLIIIYSYSLNV